MTPYVVATAGHVDHGKSTLVRALTGIEPDRWAEERRRGLTIDLGFAWTTLPSGRPVAFVDVPGHERFLGNMLAGLGPAPVVCFVVAADEGWSAQSEDHRDAVEALGIEHGLLVITRADRAPERVEATRAQAREALAGTGLADAPAVVVSAVTGQGLEQLRSILDAVLASVPPPDPQGRLRLWLDRSFSIVGAGTVVTGTLAAGTLERGDTLALLAQQGPPREVGVRGLQSHGAEHDRLVPVDRVAVNLRGVDADAVARGDVLVGPGQWHLTSVVDVRRAGRIRLDEAPTQVTVHVGTAAVPARLRPLGADHARLTLARSLPLAVGDRLLLHDRGAHRILGGVRVLDPDPPALRRRGDGTRRAQCLTGMAADGDVRATVERHGAIERRRLQRLGHALPATMPDGILEIGDWWLSATALAGWRERLESLVEAGAEDPVAGGVPLGTARSELGQPAAAFLEHLVSEAGLEVAGGRVRRPGSGTALGRAEPAVASLEARLGQDPFAAPEADELAALGLGVRELAAAERVGRLLRIADGVVVAPNAPALAMRELARLPQPFTLSAARQALATTRRVAVPLLEHLDRRGWTRRVDPTHRVVVR